MKVTKELSRKVKDYIFQAKRNADIIDKQIINKNKKEPYLVYMTRGQKGWRFTFSTEQEMYAKLKETDSRMTAYCKLDRNFYNLYQMYEHKEINLDTYLLKTAQVIEGSLVKKV